jgi:hypothetical protein
MRARLIVGLVFVVACGESGAEIPDPSPATTSQTDAGGSSSSSGDVEDSGQTSDTDAGATEAFEGAYFASCLSELANGSVKKTFSFWATAKVTPSGNFAIVLEALKLDDGQPPTTISRTGIVSTSPEFKDFALDASGSFVAEVGSGQALSFPGSANPISGTNVVIALAGLKGRFASAGFCARLTGHVTEPVPAARDLDENKNTCLFTPVKDGDAAPTRTFSDYTCPL